MGSAEYVRVGTKKYKVIGRTDSGKPIVEKDGKKIIVEKSGFIAVYKTIGEKTAVWKEGKSVHSGTIESLRKAVEKKKATEILEISEVTESGKEKKITFKHKSAKGGYVKGLPVPYDGDFYIIEREKEEKRKEKPTKKTKPSPSKTKKAPDIFVPPVEGYPEVLPKKIQDWEKRYLQSRPDMSIQEQRLRLYSAKWRLERLEREKRLREMTFVERIIAKHYRDVATRSRKMGFELLKAIPGLNLLYYAEKAGIKTGAREFGAQLGEGLTAGALGAVAFPLSTAEDIVRGRPLRPVTSLAEGAVETAKEVQRRISKKGLAGAGYAVGLTFGLLAGGEIARPLYSPAARLWKGAKNVYYRALSKISRSYIEEPGVRFVESFTIPKSREQLLRMMGKKVRAVHMTEHPAFEKALKKGEIELVSVPEMAKGFRKKIDALHFYVSAPHKGEAVGYLAYVGIGAEESSSLPQFRLIRGTPKAIIFDDTVAKIPRSIIEAGKRGDVARVARHIGMRSGELMIPTENLIGASMEGQLVYPAKFKGRFATYPGTVVSLEKIGWTLYKQGPKPSAFLQKIGGKIKELGEKILPDREWKGYILSGRYLERVWKEGVPRVAKKAYEVIVGETLHKIELVKGKAKKPASLAGKARKARAPKLDIKEYISEYYPRRIVTASELLTRSAPGLYLSSVRSKPRAGALSLFSESTKGSKKEVLSSKTSSAKRVKSSILSIFSDLLSSKGSGGKSSKSVLSFTSGTSSGGSSLGSGASLFSGFGSGGSGYTSYVQLLSSGGKKKSGLAKKHKKKVFRGALFFGYREIEHELGSLFGEVNRRKKIKRSKEKIL